MTERERLIELLKSDSCESPMLCDPNCKYASLKRCYEERTADFLLENGVIVPPCCIGDTVYEIRENGKNPISGKRFDRCITTVQMLDCAAIRKSILYAKEKRYAKNDSVRLGKTVFLTREEAEKALAERNGKE